MDLVNCTELRATLRRLWLEHVLWTRLVIISTYANLPDVAAATQRLLRNQKDISDALRPFIGNVAADQLNDLLREHITGAAEVLAASKANASLATQATGIRLGIAATSWYANADRISDFLVATGLGDYHIGMRQHLDQTMAESAARLRGDWAADVVAYDAAEIHILGLADGLAAAIEQRYCAPPSRGFSLGQALVAGTVGAIGGWVAARNS